MSSTSIKEYFQNFQNVKCDSWSGRPWITINTMVYP